MCGSIFYGSDVISNQTRNQLLFIIFRYYLGTFHEAKGFQLLSGIMVQEHALFWKIFIYMIFSIWGISFQYITIKKCLDKFKEYKIKKNIQINIQEKFKDISEIRTNDFLNDNQQLKFNNVKHNDPIYTGTQMIGVTFISFGILSFLFFVHEHQSNFDDKMIPYLVDFYKMLFIEPIVIRLIIPCWHITVSKDLRQYVLMASRDMGLIK